jgi:DNA-binding MarR family transcriptional regulator
MRQVSILKFADKMNEVMPVIIKGFARRQTDELYKGKITLPQFLILEFLYKEGGSKMTTLAHYMEVTTAAMTGIVDRLVKCGYIIRIFDSSDRRIIKTKLTPKGAELVKRITQQRRQMIINIFGKISEVERNNYLSILMRISDILAKQKEAQAG